MVLKTKEIQEKAAANITLTKIFTIWLPLAASWMLMSLELPAINAVIARLDQAEINLAAYGGVAFPIALTIEAPVMMLLAASTALSKDWESYRKLRRFTWWLGGILSALHLIVAVTPIYDLLVKNVLQVPEVVVEPGRLGMIFLTPWSLAIAYRRFQHGALIRYGHSKVVGQTTLVRLCTVAVVLGISYWVGSIPGTMVAGLAQGLGVTVEAIFAGIRVRAIIKDIKAAPPAGETLTRKRLAAFYFPLALTTSLWLLWQPLISGAVSRMPSPLESLAVWSVVTGLLFMSRSPGTAYNEVVVAMLEKPKSFRLLRKFAWLVACTIFLVFLAFLVTPLSRGWFAYIANLPGEMISSARVALALGLPLGVISVYISFFQGIIVNGKKTRAIPEAVGLFLVMLFLVLIVGVLGRSFKGVYVASAAFTAGHLAQCFWLWLRSRKQRQKLQQQEALNT